MKKILAFVLMLSLLFSMFAFEAYAWNPQDLQVQNIADGMNNVVKSLNSVGATASNFSKAFNMFASACTGVANFLTIANGSVEFLKLIGVMKDPVEQGIQNILNQLDAMDTRLSEMQGSINDIASAMTDLQATAAVNERGRQASELLGIWRNFSEHYMEDALDAAMNEYASRTMTDLRKWCRNEDGFRTSGDAHTDSITVFYADDGEPVFTCLEKQVAQYKLERPYVVLHADLLPERVVWDADSFQDDIALALETNIRDALSSGNYEAFADSNRVVWLTEAGQILLTDEKIRDLAYDAMQALTYQICFNIANDPSYSLADQTYYAFENYYQHLTAAKDGLDAWIQSLYLTHAFEFQVKDMIRDFCDRVNIKAGVYSLFLANMLGMSDTLTNAQKEQGMKDVAGCLEFISQAAEHSLSGNDAYCYILNKPLVYKSATWQVAYDVYTEEWSNIFGTYRRYEGYKLYGPNQNLSYSSINGDLIGHQLIGGVNGMTVINTLKSCGVDPAALHSYFKEKIGDYSVGEDYGYILLNAGNGMTLPVNGDVSFRSTRIIGNWFKDSASAKINSLPGDAESGYLKGREKVEGDAYNTRTGSLESNMVLVAGTVYGEGHGYWKKDEVASFGGPAGYPGLDYWVEDIYLGSDEHRYDVYVNADYNCLCTPIERPVRLASSGSDDTYDPLQGLAALNEELAVPGTTIVKPVPVPDIEDVTDLELSSLVWCDIEEDDEKVTEAALVRLEEALEAAGRTMTDDEKKAFAARMVQELRQAETALLNSESLQPEDPLGLGQNTSRLRSFAFPLLPSQLQTPDRTVSSLVRHVYSRLLYEAFPVAEFTDGEPVIRIAYHVTPYLVIGEVSGQVYQIQSFEIPAELLEENGLRLTLRLPAAQAGVEYPVSCLDDSDRMEELARISCTAADDPAYVEIRPENGISVFLVGPGREIPNTDGPSAVRYSILLCGACLLLLQLRRSRREED